MVVYFVIGVIVSALETFLAWRDLQKYGLSIYDIFPELSSYGNVGIVCVNVFTGIALAIVWPVQVSFWIYKGLFRKKVQETKEDLA